MSKLHDLLDETINDNLKLIVVSRPRSKNPVYKIKIRPVLLKGIVQYQETSYVDTKVFHKNYSDAEIKNRIAGYMEQDYIQLEITTNSLNASCLVNKKGEANIKIKKNQSIQPKSTVMAHNKQKKYILKEGTPVGFLIDLGVMTKEGKIINSHYDKYKQINRFLEFVEDILEKLPKNREIRIIDFGCGKSYLTFAMYYYLKELNGYDIKVTGLDLKEDVINKCNLLKDKYGYDKLEFVCGNVETYDGANAVDMVVTLHACDTATDYALYKAVSWGASVILSVPCCQHEVNKQISSNELKPLLKYGLIKERMSALITDGVRAELLKLKGYDVSVLEFIDIEHTPKNVLIRATKNQNAAIKDDKLVLTKELADMIDEMQIRPTLLRLFEE